MSSAEDVNAVYIVTGQTPVTRYQDGGPPVDGIEVRFTISAIDVSGSVWVPGSVPDAERTRELIRLFVANAYEVASLKD